MVKNWSSFGSFDVNYAKRNNITLPMLFGVPKAEVSTRRILNLSDETTFKHSINNLIDPKFSTVEHAQTKQVIETVWALGKNAWSWAKDSKHGHYNASVKKKIYIN